MFTGALGSALLHNGQLLAGVLLLDWSLGLLVAAIWLELLFGAILLFALSRRSRHATEIIEPDSELRQAGRPAPTLRRRCGEFLAAMLGLGAMILVISVSIAGLDGLGSVLGWNAMSLGLVALAALIGLIQSHAKVLAGLRADRLPVLAAVYHRFSASLTHVIGMLILVPWTVLPLGPIGALVCFLAARAASDLWLTRHHPLTRTG